MFSVFKLFLLLYLMTIVAACSLPLKVTKIESMKEPVKGVRYFLKRPSYTAGLKIDFDKAKFLDISIRSNDSKLSKEAISKKKMAIANIATPINQDIHKYFKPLNKLGNETKVEYDFSFSENEVPWIKGDQIKDNIYCVQIPKNPVESPLMITLQQKMEGNPILFEAKSRITPPHWFADSESSITLDDDGYLTAIMAGEDDKSLEFIQAVASLAAKAVSPLDESLSSRCLLIDEDNFKTYVTEYFKLTRRKMNLEERLNETYQKIELKSEFSSNSQINSATIGNINNASMRDTPDTLKQMKLRFKLIDLLKDEIILIDDQLKRLQYELPREAFEVISDSDVIQPRETIDSEYWFTFKLTKQ